MKPFAVALFTTLITLQSLAGTIPAGTYSGEAIWKSASSQGSYKVDSKIQNNQFQSQYTLPDGSSKTWNFEMVETGNGFFKVTSNNKFIGQGYCLEKVTLCHYSIEEGNFSLEETLTIQDNKLYRFGSKGDESGRIVWQEVLVKK